MTERARDAGDELIPISTSARSCASLDLPGCSAQPRGGVHILAGGRLTVAGIIRQRVVIDMGGVAVSTRTGPRVLL